MRTFVAFTLPDDVADQIIDWQQANMPEGVFPEPVTNLHMTLAFLGDTPDELVPHINDILGRLNASNVSIVGPVAYEEQAKLAFLTYQETGGTEVWEQLNAELKELMGYEPQFSPWLPHTTVWRYAPDHKPNASPPLPSLSFSPVAVTLYQSVRNEGGGATYQHVSSFPIQTWDTEVHPRGETGKFIAKNGQDKIRVLDSKGKHTHNIIKCQECGALLKAKTGRFKKHTECSSCGAILDSASGAVIRRGNDE